MKDETECEELLHLLSGAVWRLNELNFWMRFECDEEDEGEMDNYIFIMKEATKQSRKYFFRKMAKKSPNRIERG